jgi:hypothetical protein
MPFVFSFSSMIRATGTIRMCPGFSGQGYGSESCYREITVIGLSLVKDLHETYLHFLLAIYDDRQCKALQTEHGQRIDAPVCGIYLP